MVVFQMSFKQKNETTVGDERTLDMQLKSINSVSTVEANEKIQQQMKGTKIAKDVKELVEDRNYAQASLKMLENKDTAKILQQIVESNARDAGIDEKLITDGTIWKQYAQEIVKLAQNESEAKRAVAEFSKEMLREGAMKVKFAQDAVEKT